MSTSRFVLATAFVVLTSAIGCGTTPPQPTPLTGDGANGLTLSGRVVDAATGDEVGVADALVTATRNGASKSVFTDIEGIFTITGLEAGEYMVSVIRDGYVEASQAVQLEGDQSVTCYLDRESDGSVVERKGRLVIKRKK